VPHAAIFLLILMMDIPRLNDTSAPRFTIMPTEMRFQRVEGTWSTLSNLILRVLP